MPALDGSKVVLSMIVKNEANVIWRCLESCRALIDYWVIVDTGSTDNTIQTIMQWSQQHNVPGKVYQRKWVDFAHNRSEALTLAKPHGDYTLIIDADDTYHYARDYKLPALTQDLYNINIHFGSLHYHRPQLVKNTIDWRYLGVIHEFIDGNGYPASQGELAGVIMHIGNDGARRQDGKIRDKDVAVLEKALETETDPFMLSRYMFYLAQSHRDGGNPALAIMCYLKRADMGHWSQEQYISCYNAGKLMGDSVGIYSVEQVVSVFERAIALDPNRAEAFYGLASFYRKVADRDSTPPQEKVKWFALAAQVAAQGAKLPQPPGLFLEPWIYQYGCLDEQCISAFWAQDYLSALKAGIKLLANGIIPDRERAIRNTEFALAQIEQQLSNK